GRQPDAPADPLAQLPLGGFNGFAEAGFACIREQAPAHVCQLPVCDRAGESDRAAVSANIVLDEPAYPPDRIARKPRIFPGRVEAFDGGVQAEMAGADKIQQIDIRPSGAAGDGDDQFAVTFPQFRQCGLPDTRVATRACQQQQLTFTLGGQVGPLKLVPDGTLDPLFALSHDSTVIAGGMADSGSARQAQASDASMGCIS